MIEFFATFIAVVAAFIAGMIVGRDKPRGNFKPIERTEYDENWINQPPHVKPWPPSSAGQKPPIVITHLYAPWKNPQ